MNRRVRKLAVFGVLAMTAAIVSPATDAIAGHGGDLTIQVSQPFQVGENCDQETGRGCRHGESMRYLAPALRVHEGDTLTFDFASFHTATLLPVGQDALTFRSGSAGGIGKPFSLFIPDADDSTTEGAAPDKPAVKANPSVMFPSIGGVPTQCGTADAPCDYDGTQVVNSGLPLGPPPQTFTTTVNANPGQSFWVICLVHTHMFLRVNVVADADVTTTQAEIEVAKAAAIATDLEWAETTDSRLLTKQSSHVNSAGQRVHDVFAGKDSHFASLFAFYPKRTVVSRGATVRYHWSDLVYEDHTVTMPAPSAFSLFDEFFLPQCDTDGAGTGADSPPTSEQPPFCADPSQLEVDLTSRVMHGFGDGIFRGSSDLEHSGLRGAQFSSAPMDVKFAARSSKKGWRYFCMLHPMDGRIVVKPTT